MKKRKPSLQYYPIYYIEPLKGNEAALGFDLFSNKNRGEAILNSLKTGKTTGISKIKLVPEKGKKDEFLILNPVYKSENNILGFISGVFKIDDIINSSLGLLIKNDLDFQIYDATENKNIPIYTTKDYFKRLHLYQSSDLYFEDFIHFPNQNWRIRFIPGKLFFLNEFIKWNWTIFVFFNIITIMFSRAVYNKIKYTNEIENLMKKSVEDGTKLRLSAHIIENTPEGVIITDKYNKIISVNHSFLKTTGYKKRDLIGYDPKILNSNHHNQFFYKEMWNSIKYKGEWRGEIWNRRKNGEIHPEWLKIITIRNKKNKNNIDYHVGMFSDLSNQEHIRKQIQHLAYYDSLTDLPNRELFNSRAKNSIIDADLEKTSIAFMFLDLDRFKNINDALGHSSGDELLKKVAASLKEITLEDEIVSRFGGDEFVILIPSFDFIDDLNKRIISILNIFKSAFIIDGKELFVTSSIGVSLYPLNGESLDELIKNADTAMYFAKRSGRNNFKFYTENMNSKFMKNLDLENKMRQALKNEEFYLEYQPQVNTVTKKIISCEALIRWKSPEFGTISPDDFIRIAEDSGLIIPITRWILEKVFYEIKKVIEIDPNIYISINISGYQIKHSNLPKMIEDVLDQEKIDLKHIELELTESMLMDDILKNAEIMSKLKDLNIKLAIDDFGTGYSSLSYLKKFPIDKLKIDKSFIDGITTNEEDKVIVKTIISMAHNLGFKVIAEGVETKEQFDFLKTYNCDEIQGYYFSKPVSIEKIMEYLEENTFNTNLMNSYYNPIHSEIVNTYKSI
ncbi:MULTISPECIES: EAL domain-containing protein [Psychrilyobacter]|uniref:EAL domain-containing protein n=1 Tax=Psychrilyobacter piezotolerans TaxID=2293438 RepID=A0ABX9KGQ8_9FUSO|nr:MULTISPECIES: EAL domain-containing protein [Psychrilyobacter]NDI77972.1 EAL domain-containing protein [Psychrilyobacter piezotolerans]RDE61916.1 EAL domain-containing protein [Psychrilyobacter sp. S5]REI41142.1 EAL domain-containing protein [Psychrilyobacter piezotolerans]